MIRTYARTPSNKRHYTHLKRRLSHGRVHFNVCCNDYNNTSNVILVYMWKCSQNAHYQCVVYFYSMLEALLTRWLVLFLKKLKLCQAFGTHYFILTVTHSHFLLIKVLNFVVLHQSKELNTVCRPAINTRGQHWTLLLVCKQWPVANKGHIV